MKIIVLLLFALLIPGCTVRYCHDMYGYGPYGYTSNTYRYGGAYEQPSRYSPYRPARGCVNLNPNVCAVRGY